MEICCEECGNTIMFVSDDDFIKLFEMKRQRYLCYTCILYYDEYEVPCGDCIHWGANDWFRDDCQAHKDGSFHLICLEKEVNNRVVL
jgi:hypothetical protein